MILIGRQLAGRPNLLLLRGLNGFPRKFLSYDLSSVRVGESLTAVTLVTCALVVKPLGVKFLLSRPWAWNCCFSTWKVENGDSWTFNVNTPTESYDTPDWVVWYSGSCFSAFLHHHLGLKNSYYMMCSNIEAVQLYNIYIIYIVVQSLSHLWSNFFKKKVRSN